MFDPLVRRLAACCPVPVAADPVLDRALAFLGWEATAGEVAAAALTLLAAGGALAGLVAAVAPAAALLVVAVTAGAAYGLLRLPTLLAVAKRNRAAGASPDLVCRAALRAAVEPTPEGTARFAAAHGDDPLSDSLRAHVRSATGSADAGWTAFADAWAEWDPTLERAASMLLVALAAPPTDREAMLDRATAAVIDGAHDRAAAFAATARGPASALYAFGVVLPLALVGMLPLAPVAGVPVPLSAVVAAYDVILPCALLAAGAWLVARRPTAFPPAPIPRSHPAVGDSRPAAAVAGVAAGALAAALTLATAPWAAPLSGPAVGLGAALVVGARPARRVRARVAAVEAGLPDALAFVGRRLAADVSLERAVADAGEDLSGPAGDAFARAAGVRRRLGVTVDAAFRGRHGAIRTLPSHRLRATAALLPLAAAAGRDGGDVLVTAAAYLDCLADAEADAERALATTAATARNTGRAFAPAIAGVTVALAGRLDRLDAGAPVSQGALGLAVGAYVVLLAAVLPALAVGLTGGFDRVEVAHEVGLALCAAGLLYPGAAFLAGAVL